MATARGDAIIAEVRMIPAGDHAPGLPLDKGAVITVGTFDGVHRGHFDVLTTLANRGSAMDLPSLLLTFEPHPLEVVNPSQAPPLLCTHAEKFELIATTGVQYVSIVPFTPSLASMSAEQFVGDVLVGRYNVRELLVGHDHGFGRNRLGDRDVLARLGDELGFGVRVLPPVHGDDGIDISSSAIRRAIAAGDLQWAHQALGRPYSLSARVVSGDRRGRLLGYPTLNLASPSERKLLPADGVYSIRVQTPEGLFGGMLNLGPRPTFGDAERRIEAHVFDASHDWYGAYVRLEFVARLRDTMTFSGIEALRAQLGVDEEKARQSLAVSSVAASTRLS